MRARYWLLLFYVLLGVPLSLWTGDRAWMGWALAIAWVMMFALLLTGRSREFTFRRRRRQMFELADRIGARDGSVVFEDMRRFGVIGFYPSLNLQTVRQGTETEVFRTLLGAAARIGYTPRPTIASFHKHFSSDAERFWFSISVRARHESGYDQSRIPDGDVFVEITISEGTSKRTLARAAREVRRHGGGLGPTA